MATPAKTLLLRLGLPALLAACLAGCAELGGGRPAVTVKISGGQTLTFALDPKIGPIPAENDDFKVQVARLLPIKDKPEAFYGFQMVVKKDGAPRRVIVDDVSDDSPVRVLDDEKPVVRNHLWQKSTRTLGPADDEIKWIYQIDDSYRVFHFTIVTADGKTEELYQASYYPGFVKLFIRRGLGIKTD